MPAVSAASSFAAEAAQRTSAAQGGPEKAFGQALREIREAQQLSQEDLALEAGYDRTYISLVERGMRSPTIRAVVKVAAVLKVKVSSIIERMEKYT